jgi:hypothetical protein
MQGLACGCLLSRQTAVIPLAERNAPYDFGQLYDCGTSRDGTGYTEATDSTDPEVLEARKHLEQILATKTVPDIPKSAREKGPKQGKKKR